MLQIYTRKLGHFVLLGSSYQPKKISILESLNLTEGFSLLPLRRGLSAVACLPRRSALLSHRSSRPALPGPGASMLVCCLSMKQLRWSCPAAFMLTGVHRGLVKSFHLCCGWITQLFYRVTQQCDLFPLAPCFLCLREWHIHSLCPCNPSAYETQSCYIIGHFKIFSYFSLLDN